MVRGLTGWALAVRETPRACWRRLPGSPRLRVLRLLRETSPGLLIMLGLLLALYAAWQGGRLFIRRPINGLLAAATALSKSEAKPF